MSDMQNQLSDTQRSDTISGVWVGERLIPLAHACMNSFLRMGHSYDLYTYNEVEGVPEGVSIKDGNKIISQEKIFWAHGGWETFTDRFAYQFLKLRGGWWVDSGDVLCASRVLPSNELVFAEEKVGVINNAVLKFPKEHFAILKLIEYCNGVDSAAARWGATGPLALSTVFAEADISQHKVAGDLIYPIHWRETPQLLFPEYMDEIRDRTRHSPFVHLWGSTLREIGFDNDMKPFEGSYIDWVYKQFLDPIIYCRLTPKNETEFREHVKSYISENWDKPTGWG